MSSHILGSQRSFRPQIEVLEGRAVPAVTSFGGDPQHSGISAVATQSIDAIHWQTDVDPVATGSTHYGAPVVTNANTVIYPTKTGTTTPNFHVLGRNGGSGAALWDVASDWKPSSYGWFPPYQPALATATNRIYFAGLGGTIYYRTNPDSASGTVTQLAFFGTLGDYTSNKATYDANVFVDSPLSVDSQGNIYFSFRVTGTNPANLTSGIARIATNGTGIWVAAQSAAGGDTNIIQCARYSAFAMSNNEATLYVAVQSSGGGTGRLLGLNSATLATQSISPVLKDPRNGGTTNATLNISSTASPMVGPDGRVFFGVFANPNNGSRGWMLQFPANLSSQFLFPPGPFGWDNTPSIVPRAMVPQYTGTSSYLLFTKDNNYVSSDADGSNKISILDPNDTEVDTHTSAGGVLIMKRIMSKVGPVHDPNYPIVTYPNAVKEWCINHAAVDPATSSVIVNSEDGHYYRWYLPTNTLSQSLQLTTGNAQPYTMTVIGMDGTMYGMEDGILFSIGKTPDLTITDTTVANNGATALFTVSLDYPRVVPITVNYATANGTAIAGTHYTATSGTLTFNPGQLSKTISVAVTPSAVIGASEGFAVNLTTPTNAAILDSQGQATLLGQPPRVQAVVVNDGTAQRSRVSSITVTFNQVVTFAGAIANSFQLNRQSDGAPVGLSATPASGSTNSVAFTFTSGPVEFGSLADGRYTLTVLAGGVSSLAGLLDGDGNGSGGDNYVVIGNPATNNLFRYFGDSDGDGDVDTTDFVAFRAAFGNGASIFDADADGDTDVADFVIFRTKFGTMVP